MNTGTNDIYLISAIKDAWKSKFDRDFDLSCLQELDVIDEWETNGYGIPSNQIHDRVDVTVVLMDEVNKERIVNRGVVAVSFAHYHRQTRHDNWGVTVYVKPTVRR